ncbi:hypothetical protein PLICRDRAFT_131763 [Plicaturopsis crispa FD-325 SS-3]|nr:hypothetical protein PLICRDRAFT_131763 [Plicaturopsis crispa FD-325 SS-3]
MATTAPQNGALHRAEHDEHNGTPADKGNGTAGAYTFDPDASPEEKAAQAGKGRDQLKPANADKNVTDGGKEVAVDTGGSTVVPTITVHDADNLKAKGLDDPADNSTPDVPGALPAQKAAVIPDWYKIGWQAVANAQPQEGEEKDKGVLDLFLSEQFYGDWYHNAAVIVFAVFASHFLTRFGFGWGWLFIILAVCNTYYSTSMTRVRRNVRDDIQRELVKTRLASEHETADWINNFLDRFWLIYEPVLSATIVSSVDQILSTTTPPFLDSLRLGTFTLGTKAPRIDKVRTFPKTDDDIVMMDWGISFTPTDVSDMTPIQAAKKVNPKIVLSVRVGKGLAGGTMPILLENLSFTGLMRIRLKLMTNFPHVQVVDLSFLEKPVFDYVLKPVGGDTFGFDIAHVPGLSAFIRDMVHATLGPMMYDPNVFTLNLEQMLSGAPIDTAIGVLQVSVHSARGIKGTKIGGGTPDPYVSLSINNRAELAKTKYKSNTYNPTWMETKFLLVNSLHEQLVLSVFDYNDHRKNTLLGAASFDLADMESDAVREGITSSILKDGKERGEIRYDVSYFPVLKPEVVDGKEELADTSVGIVRLTLHQAKDLDPSKSSTNDLNPFAKVLIGGNSSSVHKTPRVKHTNNPVWESSTEFLCSDKSSSVVTIKVIDDRDFLKDPIVGYLSIRLTDLLEAKKEAGRDWWPLSGCKSGRMRLSAEWKPLNMAGSLHGADRYTPPIGVIKLWVQKATDVKNVEAALGGKSDPYVRVQVNNVTEGRTEVVNNNLNPVWDQIIYVAVHNIKEHILLECMDYQHLTKDRSLGSVELRVADLAEESADPRYHYKSIGKKEHVDPIRLDKGNVYKGQLHYVAEFIPAVALKGVEFDSGPNEMQQAVENNDSEDGGTVGGDDSSIDDGHIPNGLTTAKPIGDEEAPEHKKAHTRNAKSTDTMRSTATSKTAETARTSGTNGTAGSGKGIEEEGLEMSTEELLQQQSGVIVFNVKSGHLAKKARLEVLLDDGYWPAFSTVKARSTQARWEHVGEGFVKELDFGRVWLRLNESDEGEKDDIIAEWKGDAKAFLENTLNGPATYTLMDEDEREKSTVEIESRYVPVPVTLEPRESINNQGVLRVDLLDGHGIRGVDRGGKSDPFAVFTLNGQKVFKSQTKKKTLTPDWQENFVVSVPSRVAADFSVEIFDWNQIEQAKSLGSATIALADIEPFQGTERVLQLQSEKHGDHGQVRVRLMFQPEIIARSRKNTSTFSSAGRAMTQIGGLPIGAGKGVFHEITGVFGKKEKDFAKNGKDENGLPPVPSLPSGAGQASQPVGASNGASGMAAEGGAASFPSLSPNADGGSGKVDPGTLRVTILDAKDMSTNAVKPYVTVRVGDKEQKTKHSGKTATPQWNEAFNFAASPSTAKLYLWVYDHKTIGKDKLLGEADVDIWRHLQPGQTSSADVFSELREGSGLVRLRLEFDADVNPLLSGRHSGSSVSIERSDTKLGAPVSPSRFSLRGRRPGAERDD